MRETCVQATCVFVSPLPSLHPAGNVRARDKAPVLSRRQAQKGIPRRRYNAPLSARWTVCAVPSPSPSRSSPPTSPNPIASPDPPRPLPPSSRVALYAAAGLFGAALSLPAVLAMADAATEGVAFIPRFMDAYSTHYEMIFYSVVFGVLHSGLASLRPILTPRMGERLYRVIFALTSLPAAGFLIAFFIAHRYDGTQFWHIQGIPGVHNAVYAMTFLSFLLLYPATFNLAEVAAIVRPGFRMYETGVTRITRHPQLWGQVLWCVAHSAWMGSSFTLVASLCLVSHHCFGAWNGDRRQRDAFGDEWFELEKRTSILPFAAVLDGKQNLELKEFLRPAYIGVVAFILGAYASHPYILRVIGDLKL